MRNMTEVTTRRARLTSKQVSYVRAKLLEKRRELLAKLDRGTHPLRAETPRDLGDDVLDLALRDGEREASFQIAEIATSAVERINEAIDRIERGSYGTCEMCGHAIPAARLRALPSATLCVKCKSELERDASARAATSSQIEDTPDASFDPERVYGTVRGRKVS